MPLTTGTRIGPYEILSAIGAGGMGEVYRARDTKLGRDVALKVLPASFASDPERLARLRREAQMLATLNHPNIAHIHGLEDSGGTPALVLELVEGPTLADRIGQGPLPPAEALEIARQLAAALEAAHDAGVVHRDLKPANIKVRDDGMVKVLDFGLAKPSARATLGSAQEMADDDALTVLHASGHREGDAAARRNTVPPSTTPDGEPAPTELGLIVGTASYMAPEQAQGKAVDKRADIWAFGVVLVEMLTGRRLFHGATISDTITAVLTREPDFEAVPPAVRKLVRRCLERDPRKRLRDIGDAMSLIEDQAAAAPATRSHARWIWAAVAMLAVVAAVTTWLWWRAPRPTSAITRFQIDAPPGTAFNYTYTGTAISPDGRAIVLRLASASNAPALWIRPLDSLAARPLPGTESGDFPFWSPDSQSVAFFASGKLRRIDVNGGSALVICDASDADTAMSGGSWSRDGVILFGSPEGLRRVAASGGEPALVLPVSQAQHETGYGSPQFLPDGDRFLFFVRTEDPARQGVYASALSRLDRRTLVLATDRKAVFVPNVDGAASFLLYTQEQTLLARRIDRTSLALAGDPTPIAANVAVFPPGFHASYWASSAGLLAYRTTASDRPRLTWVGPDRERRSETGTEDFYTHVRLSPDGTHAAVELTDGTGNVDIWIWDFARHMKTRQTFDPKPDRYPVWSPNGHEIAFGSFRDGVMQIYRKDISSGQPQVALTSGPSNKVPMDWSHDGRFLFFVDRGATTAEDIWALPLDGDRRPFPVLRTATMETHPALSPDGKWLAFETTASGRPEVFVQPFSGSAGADSTGTRWQISTEGGGRPRWSHDGRRIFFVALNDAAILTSAIRVNGASIESDPPRVFADIPLMLEARSPYDPAPDDKRVLLLERTINQGTPLLVVVNWLAGIGR